jgi:hypothetical protein
MHRYPLDVLCCQRLDDNPLAYGQLWLARHLVAAMPLPWQRYSPAAKSQQQTPRQVQRGFAALIQQIGSIATPPKTRGIPPGHCPVKE